MVTHNLSRAEYLALQNGPTKPVGSEAEPVADFWPYYGSIPDQDFEGFDRKRGTVSHAYRDVTQRFEHVLVNTNDSNVFMVLVLAIADKKVIGHYLLNLNREYGLEA
jgi:hypothetical protein